MHFLYNPLTAPCCYTRLYDAAPSYTKEPQGQLRRRPPLLPSAHNNETRDMHMDGGMSKGGEMLIGKAVGRKARVLEQRENGQ